MASPFVSIPSHAGNLFGREDPILLIEKSSLSQYPLMRATSSDTSIGIIPGSKSAVSIPSHAGNLFGHSVSEVP